MPLSKEHKSRTRERIVQSAGEQFRSVGYSGIGIDGLMAAADLTRGGFYAHFDSKESLFTEIVTHDHGLLRQLRRRKMKSPQSAKRETAKLLRDYLNPRHLALVSRGCSFAALTGDVARAGQATKQGYAKAFEDLISELVRPASSEESDVSQAVKTARHKQALALAHCILGAVILASALAPGKLTNALLMQALQTALNTLDELYMSMQIASGKAS